MVNSLSKQPQCHGGLRSFEEPKLSQSSLFLKTFHIASKYPFALVAPIKFDPLGCIWNCHPLAVLQIGPVTEKLSKIKTYGITHKLINLLPNCDIEIIEPQFPYNLENRYIFKNNN